LYENTFRRDRPDDSEDRAYANKRYRANKAYPFKPANDHIPVDTQAEAAADRAVKRTEYKQRKRAWRENDFRVRDE
jgi:hypothetical protein